ncbi:MAG: hypothetical protein VKI63_08070 [Cyanobium sp.]|nr:hypothetical protein [Cyanobium sp.]
MNHLPSTGSAGPLSADELTQLEATLLPTLERHHLRLLAHGLRTLQEIAGGPAGPTPAATAIAAWAANQAAITGDRSFQSRFTAQLQQLAEQLNTIADARGVEPLALELDDLCVWARMQADRRLTAPLSH